jgi:hypothetical protein
LTKSPRPFHKGWVRQLFCGDSMVLSVQGLPMRSLPSNWCTSYRSCRHGDITCPIPFPLLSTFSRMLARNFFGPVPCRDSDVFSSMRWTHIA